MPSRSVSVCFDADISHDGKWLSFTSQGDNGEHTLLLFNTEELAKAIFKPVKLVTWKDSNLGQFRFSLDDKYLIGSSYYTGVSNLWQINLETREMEMLTNTDIGLFAPLEITPGQLLALQFKRDGLQPVLLSREVVKDANAVTLYGQLAYDYTNTLVTPYNKSWGFSVAAFGDMDALPLYQEIEVKDVRSMQTASVYGKWSKTRTSLGGVMKEQGYELGVEGYGYLAGGRVYPSVEATGNFGTLVPFDRNTSFWLRTAAGHNFGDEESVFGTTYFGGFRNNYVDNRDAFQYRTILAMPGADIDAIPAHSFAKATAELNLRPLRLNNFGTLGGLLMWTYYYDVDMIHRWIDKGLDKQLVLLDSIKRGQLDNTQTGIFLESIKEKFPPEDFFDIICYVELHVELSVAAKSRVMIRESGLVKELPLTEDNKALILSQYEEYKLLEQRLGKAARITIAPIVKYYPADYKALEDLRTECKMSSDSP